MFPAPLIGLATDVRSINRHADTGAATAAAPAGRHIGNQKTGYKQSNLIWIKDRYLSSTTQTT
jgi:hypothetical protein